MDMRSLGSRTTGQRVYDPNKNPDEIVGIDQQRQLAQMLRQQSFQQDQGQMVSGHYVAPSWTQALGRAVQAGTAGYVDQQANNQQRDYNASKAQKLAAILQGNKPQQLPDGAPVQQTQMPAFEPSQQDQFGSPLPGIQRQPVNVGEPVLNMRQEAPAEVAQRQQAATLEYLSKYPNSPEALYLLSRNDKLEDRAYARGEKIEDRNFAVDREEKLYNRGRSDKLSDVDAERKYQDIVRKDQQGFQVSQQDRQFAQQFQLQGQAQGFQAGQQAKNQEFTAGQNALNRGQQMEMAAMKSPTGKADPANVKVNEAKDVLSILDQALPLIDKSTSSYGGMAVDQLARGFGVGTEGANAAAQLKALEGALVSKMPKMSGPQSDKDVLLYKQMAGQIGDPTIPASTKKAAMDTIREINSRAAGVPYTPSGQTAAPTSGVRTVDW